MLKFTFLRFSSARVKICQMPHVNFQLTSQFLFKFGIILYCHDKKLPCKFEAHTVSNLDKRILSKFPFLDFRTWSGENLLNSSCHFWKDKSVFLQMLHQYSVLPNITPLYFLRSNITYFVQKKPIKVQIFQIFECSGQNSSNSSCQFWTDKSIPLQILHHSSLSWHKTPL